MVAQIDKAYRRFGPGRTLRRLLSYALFEGRPHTTQGQCFNTVVFAFLRSLAALPGTPIVRSPIFITGLGRSGTTILGVMLSLHRDLGFLNEPKALWTIIEPRHDVTADYVSEGARFHLGTDDVTPRARIAAHRLYSRYIKLVGATRVVDKYPEMIFRIDFLLDLFPDAHIIFVARSGADAVHSIEHWSQRLGITHRDGKEDWWGRNDVKWKYLTHQVIPDDPYYADVADLCTEDLPHRDRAALEWIIAMREGMRQKRRHPESIIELRYEDLLRRPESELQRLFRECGLPADSAVMTYASEILYDNPPKLWPVLHPKIASLFADTMAALGYSS